MTPQPLDIDRLAMELVAALDAGQFVVPPSERWPDLDFATAYRVADASARLRRERGERPVGRKIGYTNGNIWAQYNMDQPIWGYMYAHTVQAARDGLAVQALSHMVSPRIEPEIAFRLSAPLPRGCRDPAEILACVEWVARAFEIVDCHYADWRFRGPDSVIDFSHHAALILGEPRTVAPASIRSMVGALRSCQVTLSCDGALIASGTGANALDHPALALALLADVVAGQHDAELLAVGEIITTGTLTDPQPAARGQTWETHTEGLELPPLAVRLE